MTGPEGAVGQTSFRRSFARWWMFGCASLCFLIALGGIFATGTDGSPGPVRRALLAVAAAFLLWIMVRVARQAIIASDGGIVVRNVFRTFRVPWADVSGFERPARYGAGLNPGLRVRLRSGGFVAANLYCTGPLNRNTFADDVISELDRLKRLFAPAD